MAKDTKRRGYADMTAFGRYVHDRLKELGLTKIQLADISGVSHQTINSLQFGDQKSTDVEVLDRLAAGLQVSPDYLAKLFRGEQVGMDGMFNAIYNILLPELAPDRAGPVTFRLVRELSSQYIF